MIEMKIRDEEMETLSNNIMDLATQIDSRIQTLIEALTNVCMSGVSEGDFHNNLELYISVLQTLSSELPSWSTECDNTITNFLERLEEVDGNLYSEI